MRMSDCVQSVRTRHFVPPPFALYLYPVLCKMCCIVHLDAIYITSRKIPKIPSAKLIPAGHTNRTKSRHPAAAEDAWLPRPPEASVTLPFDPAYFTPREFRAPVRFASPAESSRQLSGLTPCYGVIQPSMLESTLPCRVTRIRIRTESQDERSTSECEHSPCRTSPRTRNIARHTRQSPSTRRRRP
jgi:hypothetical protein